MVMSLRTDWLSLETLCSELCKMGSTRRNAEFGRLHRLLDARIKSGGPDAIEARIERAYLYGVEDSLREDI
jgi:hypothetical protein